MNTTGASDAVLRSGLNPVDGFDFSATESSEQMPSEKLHPGAVAAQERGVGSARTSLQDAKGRGVWEHLSTYTQRNSSKSNSSTNSKKSAKIALPATIPKNTRLAQQHTTSTWWDDDFMFPTAKPIPSSAVGDDILEGVTLPVENGPPIPLFVAIPGDSNHHQRTDKPRLHFCSRGGAKDSQTLAS
jgi:hypothetical protein